MKTVINKPGGHDRLSRRGDTLTHIEIVDVHTHPAQASANGISVTPTLVKLSPAPVRRVIGNLSDIPQVLALASR